MNPPPFTHDQPLDEAFSAPEEAEERVGHCRPPRRSRFKPGVSGNPRGRPSPEGARGRDRVIAEVVQRAFKEIVDVPAKDGGTRRMSKLELALTQLVNAAASGDLRAMQMALSLHPNPEKAAPRRRKRIGKDDSLVVAEIIRRFSRPPVPEPAEPADDDKAAPPAEGETP